MSYDYLLLTRCPMFIYKNLLTKVYILIMFHCVCFNIYIDHTIQVDKTEKQHGGKPVMTKRCSAKCVRR